MLRRLAVVLILSSGAISFAQLGCADHQSVEEPPDLETVLDGIAAAKHIDEVWRRAEELRAFLRNENWPLIEERLLRLDHLAALNVWAAIQQFREDPAVLQQLLRWAGSEDARLYVSSIGALGRTRNARAQAGLLSVASQTTSFIKMELAIEALARSPYGPWRVADFLVGVLDDPKWASQEVRITPEEIRRVADERGVDAAVSLVIGKQRLAQTDVYRAAVLGLWRLTGALPARIPPRAARPQDVGGYYTKLGLFPRKVTEPEAREFAASYRVLIAERSADEQGELILGSMDDNIELLKTDMVLDVLSVIGAHIGCSNAVEPLLLGYLENRTPDQVFGEWHAWWERSKGAAYWSREEARIVTPCPSPLLGRGVLIDARTQGSLPGR